MGRKPLYVRATLAAALLAMGVSGSPQPASPQPVLDPDAPAVTAVVELGRDGRLSVDAWETPWAELLDALRRKAGIVVRWTPPPTGSVTNTIKQLPVEQALRSLCGPEVQLVFAYESVDAATPSVVWVLKSSRTENDDGQAADAASVTPAAPGDPLAGILRASDRAPAAAITALIGALRHPDASVRAAAVEAIGELRPGGSAAALRLVLDTDPHPDVKAAAAAALARLGGNAQPTAESGGS